MDFPHPILFCPLIEIFFPEMYYNALRTLLCPVHTNPSWENLQSLLEDLGWLSVCLYGENQQIRSHLK